MRHRALIPSFHVLTSGLTNIAELLNEWQHSSLIILLLLLDPSFPALAEKEKKGRASKDGHSIFQPVPLREGKKKERVRRGRRKKRKQDKKRAEGDGDHVVVVVVGRKERMMIILCPSTMGLLLCVRLTDRDWTTVSKIIMYYFYYILAM